MNSIRFVVRYSTYLFPPDISHERFHSTLADFEFARAFDLLAAV
jgi:hypothetical protein